MPFHVNHVTPDGARTGYGDFADLDDAKAFADSTLVNSHPLPGATFEVLDETGGTVYTTPPYGASSYAATGVASGPAASSGYETASQPVAQPVATAPGATNPTA